MPRFKDCPGINLRQDQVVKHLRRTKFSLIIDESTDVSTDKHLCLGVRRFDKYTVNDRINKNFVGWSFNRLFCRWCKCNDGTTPFCNDIIKKWYSGFIYHEMHMSFIPFVCFVRLLKLTTFCRRFNSRYLQLF